MGAHSSRTCNQSGQRRFPAVVVRAKPPETHDRGLPGGIALAACVIGGALYLSPSQQPAQAMGEAYASYIVEQPREAQAPAGAVRAAPLASPAETTVVQVAYNAPAPLETTPINETVADCYEVAALGVRVREPTAQELAAAPDAFNVASAVRVTNVVAGEASLLRRGDLLIGSCDDSARSVDLAASAAAASCVSVFRDGAIVNLDLAARG